MTTNEIVEEYFVIIEMHPSIDKKKQLAGVIDAVRQKRLNVGNYPLTTPPSTSRTRLYEIHHQDLQGAVPDGGILSRLHLRLALPERDNVLRAMKPLGCNCPRCYAYHQKVIRGRNKVKQSYESRKKDDNLQ